MTAKARPILLVQGNPVDAMTVAQALRESGAAGSIVRSTDYAGFVVAVETMESHWALNELPAYA